jgi:hypothetical protein
MAEPTEQTTEEHLNNKDNTGEETFRVRVSGKHLTFASPVFKIALGSRWSEGPTLANKGPVEISVHNWDLEAFLILLRVMHGRPHDLHKASNLELLAKMAVLADYYDCQDLVGFFVHTFWLKPL